MNPASESVNQQLAFPPTEEERRTNTKAIHQLSVPNRFRLMFGLPLFPEDPPTQKEK